jgi:hypothetical protein
MNSKRPPSVDEEKTQQVGSGRNWQAADFLSDNLDSDKTRAVEHEPAADQSKTTMIGDAATEHPYGDQNDGGRLRSDPAPRLPWPARDLNKLERDTRTGSTSGRTGLHSMQQEDDRTRLYNPGNAGKSPEQAKPSAQDPPQPAAVEATNREMIDPVVGWLVVVEGRGKGRSLEIGIGANPIGRDEGQKLRVDFGDRHISREKHAILIFDPRSNRFFLQSGDVRNLTYVGDDLVLSPVELVGGETILVGETKFRFVPLCGAQFRWS